MNLNKEQQAEVLEFYEQTAKYMKLANRILKKYDNLRELPSDKEFFELFDSPYRDRIETATKQVNKLANFPDSIVPQ